MRQVAEFFHWAAHEGGWELELAPEIDRATTDHTLHGSIVGLNLREALDLILLAEGLAYEIDRGRLTVTRP